MGTVFVPFTTPGSGKAGEITPPIHPKTPSSNLSTEKTPKKDQRATMKDERPNDHHHTPHQDHSHGYNKITQKPYIQKDFSKINTKTHKTGQNQTEWHRNGACRSIQTAEGAKRRRRNHAPPQNGRKQTKMVLPPVSKRQPPIRGMMPRRGEIESCDPMGVGFLTWPIIWPKQKQKRFLWAIKAGGGIDRPCAANVESAKMGNSSPFGKVCFTWLECPY